MQNPNFISHITLFTMAWVVILIAAFTVEALAPVRACPEQTGACRCNAFQRSVSCTRLASLTRKLPVGIPSNTRKLSVTYSTLNRLGPAAFRTCYELEEVNLSSNRLEDISPRAFHKIERLVALSLANNKLRFLTEDTFMYLRNLKYLDLSNNHMVVLTPRNFALLLNLRELVLLDNPVMCMGERAFAGLDKLESLQISGMKTILASHQLSDLSQLRKLVIRSLHKVKSLPQYLLHNNTLLEELEIGDIPGLGDEGLNPKLLTGLERLTSLSIKACGLTRVPRRALERVEFTLRKLDLSNNPLNELLEHDVKFLRLLTDLKLANTGLTVIHPGALQLPNLNILDVSSNSLQTIKRSAFGETLHRLTNISLHENPWTCDCELRWIIQTKAVLSSHLPVFCVEPLAMQGFDIRFAKPTISSRDFFACTEYNVPQRPNITLFGVLPQLTSIYRVNGDTVSLSAACRATGYPKPTINWIMQLKQPGGKEGSNPTCMKCERNSANPELNVEVSEDGTLHLRSASTEESVGTYTCRVENRLGVVDRSFRVVTDPSGGGLTDESYATNGAQGNGFSGFPVMGNFGWRSKTGNPDETNPNSQPLLPMLSTGGLISSQNDKQMCEELQYHPTCAQKTEENKTPAANSAVSRPSVIQLPSNTAQKVPMLLGSRKEGLNTQKPGNGAAKHYLYMRLAVFVLMLHHVLFGA